MSDLTREEELVMELFKQAYQESPMQRTMNHKSLVPYWNDDDRAALGVALQGLVAKGLLGLEPPGSYRITDSGLRSLGLLPPLPPSDESSEES